MKRLNAGIMAKKSAATHGRLQNGCVSGFINMFDFRRSTRRLISNGRPSISEISSNESVIEGHIASCGSTGENVMAMSDTAKTRVKELMEEDMLSERVTMNLFQVGSSTKTGFELNPIPECFEQVAEPKTWDTIVSETIEEQISKSECVLKNDIVGALDMLSAQADKETDRKLVAAVKQLVEQKLSYIMHSEEENSGPFCCEDLMDGVRIFTANYGLFQELLQESKSRSASTKGVGYHKNANFFHARSKSLESFFHEGGCHSPLVALNAESADSEKNVSRSPISSPSTHICKKVKTERSMVSGFSFTEMKTKLQHSMGKKETVMSSDKLMVPHSSPTHQIQAQSLRENMGMGSRDSQKLCTGRSSSPGRKGEDVKLKDNITLVVENSSRSQRQGRCKIYDEAKKHISELLMNADENSEPMTKQMPKPKSLAMMLSDPVDSSPSCSSPGECDRAELSQNCISESQYSQQDQDNHPISVGQTMNMKREASSNDGEADDDKINSSEMNSSISYGGNNLCQSTFQEDTVSEGANIGEAGTTATGSDIGFSQRSEPSTCAKSDSSEEDGLCSSPASHSPISREMEDCEHTINKLEQPSPVSVLQPLLIDDTASIISEPAGDIEPQHINFEDQSDQSATTSYIGVSLEDEESPFEYLEAVLLGSGMDWDDFHLKWLSLQPILDTSLFDEIEAFSKQASHDQRLLFDCANEALKNVCDLHFGWWKTNTPLPIPTSADLVNEIWRQVEWRMLQQMRAENYLDQILQIDLAASEKWINFQQDIQVISSEIQETIFYELIEDSFQRHQPQ